MATFMVLVDGEVGGWRIDRDALTVAIRDRWAEVEVDARGHRAVQGVCWRFETQDGPGEAFLHEDGTCLYMDLGQEYAACLAVVFRRLTPAGLDLVFCDEGYNFDVRLRSEATDAELVQLMTDL